MEPEPYRPDPEVEERRRHLAARTRSDWERRAEERPHESIASGLRDELSFRASGRRDAELFFQGLEERLHTEAVVLDLGCGIGRMDEWIAPRVKELVLVDVSPTMIRLARERLAELPNLRFLCGSGCDLAPIASSSIDLLFSYITFQHLPPLLLEGYLHEVWRVLKPGGTLVFQLPLIGGSGRERSLADEDTIGSRAYDPAQVEGALASIGYRELQRSARGEADGHHQQARFVGEKPR